MDTSIDIVKLLLPEVLVDYFKLTKHEVKQGELHFYFTELNHVPQEFKDVKLTSKGFFAEATVQDFPIRGKNVYLHIIRRRWLNESSKKVITRDWQLVAKGTRITSEFAAFLKDISQ
ncbi:hypothetical protein IMCC3317_46870 [Kordia antarctica]|uniref:Transposase n=1 Tax=Kordia antarctica TaxID=1218801 RepID=A0A7L4ZS20_9FLAO|nr:transposase [Kordia antarctica]QHI39277.1 hypothetical protein IMCC3317_46870 [Kordia antarctica]